MNHPVNVIILFSNLITGLLRSWFIIVGNNASQYILIRRFIREEAGQRLFNMIFSFYFRERTSYECPHIPINYVFLIKTHLFI